MIFDLKKSSIYLALKWEFAFRFVKVLKWLFLFLFIVVFAVFLLFFFNIFQKPIASLLGFSLIFLSLFLLFWHKESFFKFKLKNPKLKNNISQVLANPAKYNLAEFLSFEVAKAAGKSEGSGSLLLFFLLSDRIAEINFIFSRALLNLKEIKKTAGEIVGEKDLSFEAAILEALKIAQKRNHLKIEPEDLLVAFAKRSSFFKKALINSELAPEDIENLAVWVGDIRKKRKKKKRFWDYENLLKRGTLAKEWAAGYTVTLDRYSRDITDVFKRGSREIIGRQKEIKMTERILAGRTINNVLIVGRPGAGRKSLIYGLAEKTVLGRSLPGINYKRIVELDMAFLLAEIESGEEVESVLDKIFYEATEAGNIILVINNFHNYLGRDSGPGIINISGIIASYLQTSRFRVIAVTSYRGLHGGIERNPSILSLFKKVEVSELSPKESLLILENLAPSLERKYKRFISYSALKKVIYLSEQYLPSLPFPKKALETLDEAVIYAVNSTKDKIVLPKHVAKVVAEKSEIPVGKIEEREKKLLLNMETLIHKRVINQDKAVKEISAALRRARTKITVRKGPMGAFIFLGPTGVGKTETSKALAEVYFGSEEKMIRLDMSEFQNLGDISRLIGSSGEKGLLTTAVRENPFSLVLLDEFEKAHSNILNLFLQVLDEGRLTDGFGRKVSFKNTIIIATSNAGYKVILQALKEKVEWSGVKKKLLDYLFSQRVFRPELVNRFDSFVVFSPLSKSNLLDIAQLMLGKLKRNLKKKGVEFVITEPLKKKIVELGYNPVFGAREMRRVIQDKIENILASALLKNELKRGERIEIEAEKFKIIKK